MEAHIQHLSKLTRLEEHLTTLLEKIDQEIIQTDIEWLHLKSVSENENTDSQPSSSKEPVDVKPKNLTSSVMNKIKVEFDPSETNMEELKLDPRTKARQVDEEYDSD